MFHLLSAAVHSFFFFWNVFVPCVASRLDVHQRHFFEGGEVLQFPFSVERHIDSGPRQTYRYIKNTSKRL